MSWVACTKRLRSPSPIMAPSYRTYPMCIQLFFPIFLRTHNKLFEKKVCDFCWTRNLILNPYSQLQSPECCFKYTQIKLGIKKIVF